MYMRTRSCFAAITLWARTWSSSLVKAAESAGKDRRQIAAYERKTTPAPSGDDTKGQSA